LKQWIAAAIGIFEDHRRDYIGDAFALKPLTAHQLNKVEKRPLEVILVALRAQQFMTQKQEFLCG
jgi:hypothetical protein